MRYFLGFLIAIGLIILVIILIFRGPSKPKVPATSKPLDSYVSTNAEVIMTTDGPVNAESLHQQVRITVERNNVTYEQINGYGGNVANQKVYANNADAFENFLKALSKAGFTRGNNDKALADEKGFCPLGRRYVFELTQGTQTLERYWATSCGNPKTYLGNLNLTLNLFQAQVPDYNDLVSDLTL